MTITYGIATYGADRYEVQRTVHGTVGRATRRDAVCETYPQAEQYVADALLADAYAEHGPMLMTPS